MHRSVPPHRAQVRAPRTPARRWRGGVALSAALAAVVSVGPASPVAAQGGAARRLASAPGDTIVRQALDASRARGVAFVFVLDAMDAHVERDGTGTRTHRTVTQVLTQAGVPAVAERQFNWQPGRQEFRLDWVRVLRPDGTVVSDAPSADRTSDATPALQNPIYIDSRTRRVSLAGVEPGTLVDVQYTIIDRAPWRRGDFVVGRPFSPQVPMREASLSVSVPAGFTPRIIERNMSVRRTEVDSAGRHVYRWRVGTPPLVRPEPFAADSDGVRMVVTVSTPEPWDAVTQWYDSLARDRYALDAATAARLDSLVAGARSRRDTLVRLHRWIAQDIRYVSVSLGLGGYQPRSPAEVRTTGFGDCKDKATLFIAAARRWGIDARPVLLHLNGVREPDPVSLSRFNHVIAVVVERDGTRTYTDLTAATTPYGELPASYGGSYAVVVQRDGRADLVRLPQRPAAGNVSRIRIEGALAPDGRMGMHIEEELEGEPEWALRAVVATALDTVRRGPQIRAMAASYLPEAVPDSFVAFDGMDFTQPARIRVVLRDGRGARPAGPVWLLHIPGPVRQLTANATATAREIDALPRRQLPIDAERIIGRRVSEVEYRVALPAGWRAQLPADVVATSFFGQYESRYRLEGRTLVVMRRMRTTGSGVHPPERIAEVAAWMRAVAKDDVEFITLTPAP